eukprot:GFUD01125432.1.p1 GENE.GFUD01125432.1~~GFUD01125432.1.p1  ORF type:complete len:272 (+),score=82.89 GFUD01125432.1:259-1074(+)
MVGAWRKVELDGQAYLFQLDVSEDRVGYTCYLTDLVNIYKEKIDKDGFTDKFVEINSDLEDVDILEWFKEVNSIMNSDVEKKLKGEIVGDFFNLEIKWFSDEIPIRWIFKMTRGSPSDFHDQVTKSLLLSMSLLLGEREELVATIRSKDLEIEDYENSGARLTRKALKTTWFKPELAFNETKTVVIEDELAFLTSEQIQSIMNKTLAKKVEDEVDLKGKVNGSSSQASKSIIGEAKSLPPKLSNKRKVVKPDLAKIADSNKKNKRSKLNSL